MTANTHDRATIRHAWIEATRPRSLPLAASGSLIAAGVAASLGAFRADVFALMFLVSVLLQIIANFADDYGDLAHGLDNETRVGPKRGMQRGIITPAQMKRALVLMCALTFCLGVGLVSLAFAGGADARDWRAMGAFVLLGIAAIGAAVLYTVGPHPYGYLGLGDIMSFLFFGIVAVVGGSCLYTHAFQPAALVLGVALGLPVAAVMNVNNMRDAADDAAKGKRTIANQLSARGGERLMRAYHEGLIYLSLALFVVGVIMLKGLTLTGVLGACIVLLSFKPLLGTLDALKAESDLTKLDRLMAPTSLGTVAVAIACTLVLAFL